MALPQIEGLEKSYFLRTTTPTTPAMFLLAATRSSGQLHE
jgi:hypothetical protein